MLTVNCFDDHERDKLKTVKNKRINELYQDARNYDYKLFLIENEYTYGIFKKKKKYDYDIRYRYLPFEFICRGTYNEKEMLKYLVGYIDALRMANYWKDPIKVRGWNFTDEEIKRSKI